MLFADFITLGTRIKLASWYCMSGTDTLSFWLRYANKQNPTFQTQQLWSYSPCKAKAPMVLFLATCSAPRPLIGCVFDIAWIKGLSCQCLCCWKAVFGKLVAHFTWLCRNLKNEDERPQGDSSPILSLNDIGARVRIHRSQTVRQLPLTAIRSHLTLQILEERFYYLHKVESAENGWKRPKAFLPGQWPIHLL